MLVLNEEQERLLRELVELFKNAPNIYDLGVHTVEELDDGRRPADSP